MLALVALAEQVPGGMDILMGRDLAVISRGEGVGTWDASGGSTAWSRPGSPRSFPNGWSGSRKRRGFPGGALARELCIDIRLVKRWRNGARPDSANLIALFMPGRRDGPASPAAAGGGGAGAGRNGGAAVGPG